MLNWWNCLWNTTSLSGLFLISGHFISKLVYLAAFFLFDRASKTTICFEPNVCLQFNGRAMAELQILRLFGNPLEFLPEILPLHKLRHLSLANIRIEADESLRLVNVQIEVVVMW